MIFFFFLSRLAKYLWFENVSVNSKVFLATTVNFTVGFLSPKRMFYNPL